MDYIKRTDFLEREQNIYCVDCSRRKNSKGRIVYEIGDAPCRACGIGDVLDDLEDFPAADVPERNVGKWILVREADETGNALYECSACHMSETHSPIVEVKYCWNCGAKMEG